MQSFFYFLRFNVSTFSTLLQMICTELGNKANEDVSMNSAHVTPTAKLVGKLTKLQRHLLPALRLYSSWLLTNAPILAAGVGDEVLQQSISALWTTYAKTLSLLAAEYPAQELPETPYQLEEDVESLGFKPFESGRTRKLWLERTSRPKFRDRKSVV